jgi:C4-dicarboxylate-binding protein DctP
MRNRFLVVLAGLLLALVVSPFQASAAADAIKMRIIHSYPETTQHGRNMIKFKELAEKYTNGRVNVQLFANASVCPITKEPATVLTGGAEACYNVAGIIEGIDRAEAIWSVPYLFRTAPGDTRHIRKAFFDPEIEGVLKQRQEAKGLYRLGTPCTVDGFFFGSNKRPIKTLADFQGLKIRSPGGLLGETFMRSLGANPVVIPGTEVPVALQTGVVDALTTVPLHYHDARWHTKYATTPYWCTYSLPFLANLKWWNKLPDDIKKIIDKKVMPELMAFSFDEVDRRTLDILKIMQKPPFNVEIYNMPMAEQKKIKEATQGACIKKFQDTIGKDLADKMIKASKILTPKDMVL